MLNFENQTAAHIQCSTHLPCHFNFSTSLVIVSVYNCDGELEYKCVYVLRLGVHTHTSKYTCIDLLRQVAGSQTTSIKEFRQAAITVQKTSLFKQN